MLARVERQVVAALLALGDHYPTLNGLVFELEERFGGEGEERWHAADVGGILEGLISVREVDEFRDDGGRTRYRLVTRW